MLSIAFYDGDKYFTPIRDLYEAFGIGALMLLFTDYMTPNYSMSERAQHFEGMSPPTFFKTRFSFVFLYIIVEVIMTTVEIASQAAGTFCETSLKPQFANFWVTVIENIAISVAVTGILRFYGRLKNVPEFKCHKPLLKLISFKLIVGINFLQDLVFSIITGHDLVHGNTKITGKDLKIGIPALLVAVEQIAFAIFFHYSFRSREYHEDQLALKGESEQIQRKSTLAAAGHAFNPVDYFQSMAFALKTLLTGGLATRGKSSGKGGRGMYNMMGAQNGTRYQNADGMGEQGTYLNPAAPPGYDRSRSPSPTPAAYYQPPAGSPPRSQGRYEQFRAPRGSEDYATQPRNVV